MSNKIIIVDYGMGNLRSIHVKFSKLGYKSEISSDADKIKNAGKIILPGIGHFGSAMKRMEEFKILDALNEAVINDKTPILGICLGIQLFAEYSEEGECKGLGWVEADVRKFSINDKLKFKIPHIGWNQVNVINKNSLSEEIDDKDLFYFVHSYHLECKNKSDIWMKSEYEYEFVSAVNKENIYGTQFHPEKSHDAGSMILKRFAEL